LLELCEKFLLASEHDVEQDLELSIRAQHVDHIKLLAEHLLATLELPLLSTHLLPAAALANPCLKHEYLVAAEVFELHREPST